MTSSRLGLLADSHGRVNVTRDAVKLLRDRGCDLLLHLGDLGSEGVIDELVGHPVRIVLGNCDDDALGRYAEHVGVPNAHPAGRLDLDGTTVFFTHGHIEGLMRAALAEGVRYLLHGHSHEPRDDMVGGTRVINPGALHRAARYTAAVLEPATGALEFIEVARR